MMINIQVAWGGFLRGCLAGVIPGLFFHNSDWLGGYASWQRRMIRLAVELYSEEFTNWRRSRFKRAIRNQRHMKGA